jgi:hypothetical protein
MRFAPIIALAFLSGLALVTAIDVPTVNTIPDPDENDPNAVSIHVAASYDNAKLASEYKKNLADLNANGDPETREALAHLQAAHNKHSRQHIAKARQVALKQTGLTTVSDPPPGVDPAEYHVNTAVSHMRNFRELMRDSDKLYSKGQTAQSREEAIDQTTASLRSYASGKKSQASAQDHIDQAAQRISNKVTSFHENATEPDPYLEASVHHDKLHRSSLKESAKERKLAEQATNPGDMTSHAWNSAKLLSEAKGHDKQKSDNLSKSNAASILSRRRRKNSKDKLPRRPRRGPGGGSGGGTGRLRSPLGNSVTTINYKK